MFVQNDQIHRQLLHAPVFVRLEELADDLQILDLIDPTHDDRYVARNAVRPQHRRLSLTACQDIGCRAERRVRIEHVAGEALEQAGLVRVDAQVEQLDLRLGPGQKAGALERGRVVMLVGQAEHVAARGRDEGPERDVRGGSRCQPDAAAQTEDRIEHGAGRVGERSTIDDRNGRANATSASQKACPVRLELWAADHFAFDDGQVGRPDRRLVG